jgi:hypothetical protein
MRRMSRPPISAPGLAAVLLLLSACAEDPEIAARIRAIHDGQTGTANSLDDPDAQKQIDLGLTSGASTWCPGSAPPAQLRATVRVGSHSLRTAAHPIAGQVVPTGHLPYTAVAVTMKPGGLGPDWMLLPLAEPQNLLAGTVSITAHLIKDPRVSSTLQLPISFDCDQTVEFAGRPGRDGINANPGEDGEPGLPVLVAATFANPKGGPRVAFVKAVPSKGAPAYFFLAPGRRLAIDLRGGNGGAGGPGVFSLRGGPGGDGGDGGRLEVLFDRRYPELKSIIGVAAGGGRGGAAGPDTDGAASGRAGREGRPGPPAHFSPEDVTRMFGEELEAGLPILRPAPDTQI